MDEKEILEKQVEALEKLLQLRQAVIEELEAKVNKLECEKIAVNPGTYTPWITTPYVQPYPYQQPYNPGIGGSSGTIIISNTCPDGTPHQCPPMWSGTPHCAKCGQNMSIITSATTQGSLNISGNTTGTQIGRNVTYTNTAGHVPIHTTGYVAPVDMNSNVFTLDNIAK